MCAAGLLWQLLTLSRLPAHLDAPVCAGLEEVTVSVACALPEKGAVHSAERRENGIYHMEDINMKIGIYKAAKDIYGKRERLNITPVAFDYVPRKERNK